MKITTISRTEEDYCRKNKTDIMKVHRNHDPALHPFHRNREYTKAIIGVKLDKIFAKPFLYDLNGHHDSINCLSIIRNKLTILLSGACDGEIKVWDLPSKTCVWEVPSAHSGFVRGITPDVEGNTFFTCGDDKLIKHWALQPHTIDRIVEDNSCRIHPINTIASMTTLTSIDHHRVDHQFATSGESVSIWDDTRSSPLHSYKWGADSVLSVKFNPAESSLLASTGSDRSICLYDLRASVPMRKFLLPMNSNKVAWNPREPMNFILANEDHNLYSFDMRNLDKALMIHKDHISAVMDVAFSPTGREFVSGGYDRTIRLFNVTSGRSRDVYHTKRMQRVFSVEYSADSQYVISGSDDTNIRLWKAQASKSIGIDAGRQERSKLYLNSLKKRYSHMPEIKRINKNYRIPKGIKKANAIKHIQQESVHRKQENVKRHSKPSEIPNKTEREKVIVKEFK